MRVLVATQYYRPEIGATQNRLGSFVDGLVAAGHEVEVICEQPNHPAGVFATGYGRRLVFTEYERGAVIRRIWVAASPRKTTARRLAFYGTFAAGAAAATLALRRPDVVFVSSPPLPGALAVAVAASVRQLPFVLDVRDLWPAAAEALGELSSPRIMRTFERAERWIYRESACVTTTTEPFCAHINSRAGVEKAAHLPNGAMDELLDVPLEERAPGQPVTIGYAGNFGIAQGLGVVLEAAAELAETPVRFVMFGEGPVKEQFLADRDRRHLNGRVDVHSELPLSEVAPLLARCDALLVPLRNSPLLRNFIPSKLYDAMALGRPAIVAAAGEPQRLVEQGGCGVAVPPEDGPALAAAIRAIMDDPVRAAAMGRAGRQVARNLVRSRQIERLESILTDVAKGRRCAA
jgi:glycosyltransferase involved in cell wall biosynthesis